MDVGERLLVEMRRRGWWPARLAFVMGVSEAVVLNLIHGRMPLTAELADSIAEAMDVDVEGWVAA